MVKKRSQIYFLLFLFIGCNVKSQLQASIPARLKSNRSNLCQPSLVNFQLQQSALNAVFQKPGSHRMEHPIKNASRLDFQSAVVRKSKGRAFLQSLILPGWGQHYAESKTMMKVFIASEVLLWGSYLGFTTWSNWLEDDYRTFAVTHAGINLENKPERYFVDIGNFDDISEYNQAQLRDRDVSDLYPETEAFSWQWDSRENRQKFETMRIRSDRAADRAKFALAAVFLNHLVSAIHSTLAVHKFNQRLAKQEIGLRIDFDGFSENRHVELQLIKSF